MDSVKLYGEFSKVDKDKRIVEGMASTEAVDSQGEIVRIEALEKALPNYMNYGNIRQMHQWSAVGKTLEAKMEKGKKTGLWIKGKIVDNEAWEKVKEGVYNGFSIGGKILKKIGNEIHELVLNEISIVDRPANPEAVFSLVKMEGGKVIEKQLPTEATGMVNEMPYAGIKVADQLIAMTSNLTYLIEACQSQKRPVKHLEKIIKYLKQAAMFELQSEKVAIETSLGSEKVETLKKLSEAKEALLKMRQISKPNWQANYFNNLAKVL